MGETTERAGLIPRGHPLREAGEQAKVNGWGQEKLSQIRLDIGSMGVGAVEVNGVDLASAVRGLDLHVEVGRINRVTLNLLLFESVVEAHAVVTVPEETRAALMALGWTPPEGQR